MMDKSLGEKLRDEGMALVETGVTAAWKDKARLIVERLAWSGKPFTADDVWEAGLEMPGDGRALGPILMQAARAGLIVPTGQWVKCRRSSRHATLIREWIGA